jgi:hypothetical protein
MATGRMKAAGKNKLSLFEEEKKPTTTRKARRDQQAAKRTAEREAAPAKETKRTTRLQSRKKAEAARKKMAEEAAANKKTRKVTGGRSRAAQKKGLAGGAQKFSAPVPAPKPSAVKKDTPAKTTTKKKKNIVSRIVGGTVGGAKRVLLGKDKKFGGDRGLIDFARKSDKDKKKKPTSPASGKSRRPGGKAMGGMMKSKMSAKGGAKGGKKMPPGYKMGGSAGKFPDMTGDGKVTQKDILKARGVPGFSEGGGAKKSKGYSKGGVARKGKPRGVGAALRGYGKALK